MYSSGFILLYRDELEDWLFQDPQLYHWWMYLRLKATPKPCVQIVGKTRIRATLGYGEFATTISYLAKVWDADDRTVSSFLNLIEEDGRIETRKENGITIIRIREYMRFSPPSGYFTKNVRRGTHSEMVPGMSDEMVVKTDTEMGDDMSPPMESDLQSEVQTNKINLEEEKLKKSSTASRAQEIEFFERLKASEITLDEMAINLSLRNRQGVIDQLEIFKSFILPAEKFHTTFADFKRHFMSWQRTQTNRKIITLKTNQMEQMMKRQPAAGMPQISEEAQKALDELRKTTTNHFRLGVSEDELSILLTESLNNAVKCQGKNVPAEMSGVIGSIANVIHGASNCTGVLLQGDFGTGKTTLFRMIMGLEEPTEGSFKVGSTVKLAYVDQQHKSIDPEKTVFEVISGGTDLIMLGNRQVNARAYVARFNFSGADQEKKCGMLSGGERNRLHLALALKEEGNVLLLDEPTNDIDVNTLRALEEGLNNFAGCAVVISHDRWFLDRIATHILSFEGDSKVVFYQGSYSEYEEWKRAQGSIWSRTA